MLDIKPDTYQSTTKNLEITFPDIISFLRRYLRFLLLVGFISGLLGYSTSYLYTKMYTSKSILLPEQSPTSGSLLANLAGLGGISALEKIGAVKTDLYPNIMESLPFALHILKLPVVDSKNKKYNSFESFLKSTSKEMQISMFRFGKQETLGIPTLQNKDILNITKEQERNAKTLLSMINTNINAKTGIITIEAEAPDPVIAAVLVAEASDYLMHYVEDYRTGKTAQEVKFLEKRMIEAKSREFKAEYALQSYRDRNRNAYLNVARIEEQRLQADFTLAQSLYGDLSRKYEQAKVKVKEDQPIFKVLEPAKVPLSTSKPRRIVMAFAFSFLGVLFSLIYIFIRLNK